jgi:hypothetical protein
MMPKRLKRNEKQTLNAIGTETLYMRADHQRRLRNALVCLAQCDPHWLEFIERNIPNLVQGRQQRRILQLVESRARCVTLHQWNYFSRKEISAMIFRDDWFFTDNGDLSPG